MILCPKCQEYAAFKFRGQLFMCGNCSHEFIKPTAEDYFKECYKEKVEENVLFKTDDSK